MPRRRHARPDTVPPLTTDLHRTAAGPTSRTTSRARRLALPLALLLGASLAGLVGGAEAPPAEAVAGNPLARAGAYTDPSSLAAYVARTTTGTSQQVASVIAGIPQARWVTPNDGAGAIGEYLRAATAARRLPVLVLYAIPDRDCGGFSSGGLANPAQYLSWVSTVRSLVAKRQVVVVLEPDALSAGGCVDGSKALRTRVQTLAGAVDVLTRDATTAVYIDAGHEDWLSPREAANRLAMAHVAKARGFSLNVSNFYSTSSEVAYGQKVASLLGGAHFVVDTSRNGAGPTPTLEWCNPAGRLAGGKPHAVTGTRGLDGYLWIKHPGESDGTCSGGPHSGAWFTSWVDDFAIRSRAAGKI